MSLAGVFGVLAYTVEQRARLRRAACGVRRALGAATGDVLRLVAGSAARLVATGLLLGLGSLALGRLLGTLLVGVQPLNLPTFVGVAAILALTAAVAIAEPARGRPASIPRRRCGRSEEPGGPVPPPLLGISSTC